MRRVCGAVVLIGLAAAGAPAQEPVTFKGYAYAVGDKTRTTKTEDTISVATATGNGKANRKEEEKKKTLVYTTEVLRVGPDPTKPEKLSRRYEKAVETVAGVETRLPLDGKTVVIEKKGETFAFTLPNGTALTGGAAAELEKDFNKKRKGDDELFPTTPIKPGDKWDLTEKFLQEADSPDSKMVVIPDKSKATGKLISTTQRDGSTFGVAVITSTILLSEVREETPIKLIDGKMSLNFTANGCLDGTNPEGSSGGTMTMSCNWIQMGVNVKVDVDMRMTSRVERVAGPKR